MATRSQPVPPILAFIAPAQIMKIFHRAIRLSAACLVALVLVPGCATQVKQAEETNPRVVAAKSAFGPGFDYMIVEKGGNFSDKMFVTLFKTGAESDLSRQLFARLATAENKPTRFMVTGENAEKTTQVIIEALSFAPQNGLPYLELLYLGERDQVPGIEQAVKRVGGQLRFAPYPG
jgi:hypothetical protein